jgi:hypothetical protein
VHHLLTVEYDMARDTTCFVEPLPERKTIQRNSVLVRTSFSLVVFDGKKILNH